MEFEHKYIVRNGDFESVRTNLTALGFARGGVIKHQVDIYFLKSEQGSEATHFIADGVPAYMRLRHDVNANTFSFDIKLIRQYGVYGEHEVRIIDEKSFADCEAILTLLGYRRGCITDKKRETWKKDNVEIVLDDVKDLGAFIEIEIIAPADEKDNALKRIDDLAAKLGLSPVDTMKTGYVNLWALKQSGIEF